MGRRLRKRDGAPPKQLNPLKIQYSDCLSNLSSTWVVDRYFDLQKPFVIDIGCGDAEWIISSSQSHPEYNFLGLEIRVDSLLNSARSISSPWVVINPPESIHVYHDRDINISRSNLGLIYSNILTGDLSTIFNYLRDAGCHILFVCVQYPDPHWKSRNQKRRVLSPSLMRTIASYLHPGGVFYLQSDVKEVIDEVRAFMVPLDVCSPLDGDEGEFLGEGYFSSSLLGRFDIALSPIAPAMSHIDIPYVLNILHEVSLSPLSVSSSPPLFLSPTPPPLSSTSLLQLMSN
jgi:tRNA (guanine-N7-)-methyltransferase